ncbi:hypothetical protein [Schleiferilactobacillus harbinensis]
MMAKKYYNTHTPYYGGGPVTVIGNGLMAKSVPVFAEVDDETGEVKLFIRHQDLPRLGEIRPLSDAEVY